MSSNHIALFITCSQEKITSPLFESISSLYQSSISSILLSKQKSTLLFTSNQKALNISFIVSKSLLFC